MILKCYDSRIATIFLIFFFYAVVELKISFYFLVVSLLDERST